MRNEIDIETAATRWHAHGHTIRMKYDHGIWMNEEKREKNANTRWNAPLLF